MAPINTEMLIEIVQKYPVLYDTSHRDYKNVKIKNKIWDNIAEILGGCNRNTLRKQWKNLRDAYSKHLRSCKTSTAQEVKLTERYRTWPWATLMYFLRPHLEFAEKHSNIQRSAKEAGSAQSINTAQSQPNDLSRSHQDDTPQQVHSGRERTSDQSQSQVNKVINFVSKNTETDDDTDLLFKSYAKKVKNMTNRRQATVKFEIAKIMLKADLEEANEMQSRSDVEEYQDNSMVMKVEPPANSPDSDTNGSVHIVSSPPPVLENVDPLNTSSLLPSYMQSLETQPSYTESAQNLPSNTLPKQHSYFSRRPKTEF